MERFKDIKNVYIAENQSINKRTKLIKKRNEAATKIQKAFQNSKSQKIKNLPKKAKEEVQKLKANLKKPETAAEKVKRLNRTTEEIVKNQRERSGQNYNAHAW